MKHFLFLCSVAFLAVACKSTKKNTTTTENQVENNSKIIVVKPIETKTNAANENKRAVAQIATAHYGLFNNFNTLNIIADVHYKDKNLDQSPIADIKIEKNKQILITVKALFGVTVAKVYLTPERASYYEIMGSHYDGDYNFIKTFLGTEVTYENVENLLLGKAFYDLNTNNYQKIKNNELELKLNQFLMRLVLGSKNQVASTEVTENKSSDKLVIQYPMYQSSENIYLPKEIKIHAMRKDDIQISIDYKKVSVNPSIDFKYKIPSGSKAIKI
ncbi:DUF4292 domain-containing protein [Myroides sp. JBRI-B21084]|uniref:DUF4292 domain-containing protein n=1 Tax=Myroides sp. JBRI-B21084 TaxID=3119977 RepID=UPI0026E1770A|nr:DUF4292 domain-containing protein [Paenimyroides cloacae]WKW45884.1 DUF4292 domain-containing protein [Paenimyroides cloacae]